MWFYEVARGGALELPTLFLRGVLALKIDTKTTSKDRYLFWGCSGDQGDQKGV